MVEINSKEYGIIFRWFERAFGLKEPTEIPLEDKRVFWKLTFLAEDRIEEDKLTNKDES